MICPRCKSNTVAKAITDGYALLCCGHYIYQPEEVLKVERVVEVDIEDFSAEPVRTCSSTDACRTYIKAKYSYIKTRIKNGETWTGIHRLLIDRKVCKGVETLKKYYRSEDSLQRSL